MAAVHLRLAYIITAALMLVGVVGYFGWRAATTTRVVDLEIQDQLPGQGVFRTFGWHDPLTGTTTRFHVVAMSGDAVTADLWFHPIDAAIENSRPLSDLAQESGAVYAINGGYFTSEFLPSGLAISNGETWREVSDEPALSGFLTINSIGSIHLTPRGQNLPDCIAAIQAGPFLIDPGGRLGIHTDDNRSQRRSVIANSSDGQLLLIVADAISLYQLAILLKERPNLFGVSHFERALNLDGGPSTALYVDLGGVFDSVPADGPVHNYILFNAQ